MTTWLDARIAEVRRQLTPADEGSLWVLLFDDPDGAPLTAMAVDDAMAHMDETMIRNLTHIIDEVPANAALLVIPRRDGIPRHADRQLGRDLHQHLESSSTQFLDLIVVGKRRHWSASRDVDVAAAFRAPA